MQIGDADRRPHADWRAGAPLRAAQHLRSLGAQWGGGLDAPFVDLGSGKAALVDPETGAQSQNTDLPNGVPEIAALLKTMVATAQAPAPKVPRSRANEMPRGRQ